MVILKPGPVVINLYEEIHLTDQCVCVFLLLEITFHSHLMHYLFLNTSDPSLDSCYIKV